MYLYIDFDLYKPREPNIHPGPVVYDPACRGTIGPRVINV